MKAELSGKERILRVLAREEPDRVPHFEWSIDRKVRAALAPGCGSLNEFAARMGLDAVLADPDFSRAQTAPGQWRTEWGYTIQESEEEHGVEVDSPIQSMEEFSRYAPPDPRAPGRYATIEKTLAEYGKDACRHRPSQRRLLHSPLPDGLRKPPDGHRRGA